MISEPALEYVPEDLQHRKVSSQTIASMNETVFQVEFANGDSQGPEQDAEYLINVGTWP